MTKAKVFTIKTAWNSYGSLISNYLHWNRNDLEEDFNSIIKEAPHISEKDYMWSLFNRMLVAKINLEDFYSKQISIYHSMAKFVSRFEGKDGKQYDRLAFKEEVRKAKLDSEQSPVILELEIIADIRCPLGKRLDGKKYPLDGSIADLPLAGDSCWRDFCSCTVCSISKRDENGKIIFN